MAVRRPLYHNASADVVEMTSAEVDQIIQRAIYLWSLSPNISMTVSTANSGISMSAMFDTRMQAGTYLTRTDRFATEAELPEPTQVDVKYDRIYANYTLSTEDVVTSADINPFITPAGSFPLYRTSSGHIQAMNLTDVLNTFVEPALALLATGTTIGDSQAGTYSISSSTSVADSTLVSSTEVFNNTIANTSLYTAAGIPETLDQPQTQASYYLHRRNYAAGIPFCKNMLEIATNNDIQAYSTSRMNNMLRKTMDYAARMHTGHRIDYKIGTSVPLGEASYIRGTGMVDSRRNGAGNRKFYGQDTNSTNPGASENDYRAQEFPNGSVVDVNTYYLRIFQY